LTSDGGAGKELAIHSSPFRGETKTGSYSIARNKRKRKGGGERMERLGAGNCWPAPEERRGLFRVPKGRGKENSHPSEKKKGREQNAHCFPYTGGGGRVYGDYPESEGRKKRVGAKEKR